MKRPSLESARIAIAVSTARHRLRFLLYNAASFLRIKRLGLGLLSAGQRHIASQSLDHHWSRNPQAERHPCASDLVASSGSGCNYCTDSQPGQHCRHVRAEALRNRVSP
jgi:hypothetical protein